MNFLDSTKKYFDFKNNSSIYTLWCGLFFFLVLITPYVGDIKEKYLFINQKVVDPVQFKVIYFFIILFLFFKFYFYARKRYIISKILKFIIYLSIAYYIYLRIFSNEIVFIRLSDNWWFVYADVFIILLIFMITLEIYCYIAFLPKKENNASNEPHYLDDDVHSFTDEEYEDYEYKCYVETVVSAINTMAPERAFTISINSKWGTGKTTFMKAIEKRLKTEEKTKNEDDYIIINFNVWKYDNETALLKDYFNELQHEFSKYSGNATNVFNEYISNLFFLSGINFKNFVDHSFTSFFTGKKSPYDNTKNLIERINKKVVVLIDDLDRLKINEINQTLKLIRNNSEFKNFFIIATVDHDYLLKEGNLQPDFLQKIFNLQIDLPAIPTHNLFGYYIDQLQKINFKYSKEIIDASEKIFYNDGRYFYAHLGEALASRRQVIRFVNHLKISFLNILNEDDIIFEKYILFQLFIFRFPDFKPFFDEKNIKQILETNSSYLIYNKYTKELTEFLTKENIMYNENEKNTIELILSKLFYNETLIKPNDISVKNYFSIYYHQNIFGQTVNLSAVKKAIKDKKIEDLYKESKDKTHFDQRVFINICLINGNYENIEQIISFLEFVYKESNKFLRISNNIHIDFLVFFNNFDESYYKPINNFVFNKDRMLKNKVFLDNIFSLKQRYLHMLRNPSENESKEILETNLKFICIDDGGNKLETIKEKINYINEKIIALFDETVKNLDSNKKESIESFFSFSNNGYEDAIRIDRIFFKKYSSYFSEKYKNTLRENTYLLNRLTKGIGNISEYPENRENREIMFQIFLKDEDKNSYLTSVENDSKHGSYAHEILNKYLVEGAKELMEFINDLPSFDNKEEILDKVNDFIKVKQ